MKRILFAVGLAVVWAVPSFGAERRMTFMEYNIFQCWGWEPPANSKTLAKGELGALPRIAEIIRGQKPDWVALCEVARNYHRAGFVDQPAELAKRCGLQATYFSGAGKDDRWGNAILSRERPLSARALPLASTDSPRSAIVAEFGEYYVMATHFPLKEETRLKSAEIVCAEAQKLMAVKPVFLAGDLNAEPGSPPIRKLEETFVALSPRALTWSTLKPSQCIDYIFVDKAHAGAFKVTGTSVIPEKLASDHRPVVVEVTTAGKR